MTGDNIGVEYANVVYAFEESPRVAGVLWAGTNDGLIHVSRDNGANWENVTANVPGMPKYGAVRNIDASSHADGTAYMTVDAHEMGDFNAYVYRTDDYGKTWTKITKGISDSNLSYCRMVKEDPFRKGLLYLGTENALYVSFNNGSNWQSLMSNMPASPMYWLDIPEHFNDLVVGTYGRGIWILDDISPIQQWTDEVAASEMHLFDPKDAYRFHPVSMIMQFFPEASSGVDPPYGASLHYWLSEKNAEASTDSITLKITNAIGDTIRTIKHKGKAGVNRVWWDLRDQPTTEIVMRTKPRYAPWVKLSEDRTRKSLVSPMSVLVLPGTYQVHLMKDGAVHQSNSINVLKDPNSEGQAEDVKMQLALLNKIKADVQEISTEVNKAEKIRRQLQDLKPMLSKGHKAISKELLMVDSVVTELENEMIQLKHTGKGQDGIRLPGKLLEKLSYLSMAVGTADFKPADQHEAVYDKLHSEWLNVKKEWEACLNGPVKKLVGTLQNSGVGPLIISQEYK